MRRAIAPAAKRLVAWTALLVLFALAQSCDLLSSNSGPTFHQQFALTVTASAGGTTAPSGALTVSDSTPTSLQAVPSSGFSFVCWIVERGTAQVQGTFTATTTVSVSSGDVMIKALFAHTSSSIPSGSLASYPLDGTVADSSGNGNTGTAFATTTAADRFGVPGGAAFFSGGDAYIQTVPAAAIPASLSVSLWACPTALGRQIWGSINNPSGSKNGWATFLGTDGSVSVQRYSANAGSNVVATPVDQLPLNQWTHLTFTFDGSTGSTAIYVNGTQEASGTLSILTNSNDIPLTLGISLLLQSYYFYSGGMDSVRIYSRALSNSEVYDLYTNGG
ncbi:MAG TPA: LamG-like jellyroll fold domain-containing protein [Spirochaetia bacterium]|nr:LamG-like jellyroll fold domain-containing protein [Spirochaetia bacterium]